MVKKRVRDPEILAEAPQVRAEDDGSGSDTVSCPPNYINCTLTASRT